MSGSPGIILIIYTWKSDNKKLYYNCVIIPMKRILNLNVSLKCDLPRAFNNFVFNYTFESAFVAFCTSLFRAAKLYRIYKDVHPSVSQ